MAGVSVGGNAGKKRALDSEINMIPMINLLMVTIAFLLITAVWVHAQRLEGTAQVPGSSTTPPCGAECKDEPRLHIETGDKEKFVLVWKQGATVVRTADVPRGRGTGPRTFPALASKVTEEWAATGQHREAHDRQFDHAVVHAANDMPYAELVAVMDALAKPKRPFTFASKTVDTNAFEITLAVD